MNRGLWWRFAALSVLLSLVLSLLYALLVRETTGSARAALQRSVTLILARALEEPPYPEAMRRLDRMLADAAEVPREAWLLDAHGTVVAHRGAQLQPPVALPLGDALRVHEVRTLRRHWWSAQPLMLTRLDAPQPLYLLTQGSGLGGRPGIRLQAVFFVGTLVAAMLLSLALVTLYLRGRSRAAREVIARLEAGDLQARFRPDRLDALGALMLDFNRMADEIERLVHRLQAAEDARRAMLQELGHDLRTPLTSLRTSVETLAAHGDTMPPEDRHAFLGILRGELDYFVRLVDDLFFIADLAEPRYRRASTPVDLRELAATELQALKARRPADAPALRLQARLPQRPCPVPGDAVLLARLLRNALDNAARHARTHVTVSLHAEDQEAVLRVADDGAGMSAAQVAAFGQRRAQRIQAGAAAQPSLSLGLGSVIIKTITELHGGTLRLDSDGTHGTTLSVRLPAA
jgi:signal transduction histidine kinase